MIEKRNSMEGDKKMGTDNGVRSAGNGRSNGTSNGSVGAAVEVGTGVAEPVGAPVLNGEAPSIRTVEYFDDRWYKISRKDGTADFYPSVTTKLGIVAKPFLAQWRGDIGNREADMRVFEAQERGKRIHSGWETITLGGAVVFNPTMRPNFTDQELDDLRNQHTFIEVIRYQDEMLQLVKLQKFLDAVNPEILGAEVIVYSDKYRDAGTIDNVFKIARGEYFISGRTPVYFAGGVYIGDLKTGSTFDDTAYMQMAAYANAYTERTGIEPVGTIGIHTGSKNKTGIPGLSVYVRNLQEWKQDFSDFRHASLLWERKHKDDRPEQFDIPTIITNKKKEPAQ